MHEILRKLPAGARVLDLGSRDGSFGPECCPGAFIVRLDNEFPVFASAESFVQADAAHLPFRDCAFDAVVANHVLEHTANLTDVLEEIGRISKPLGRLYVAVPDASTLSDRIYRWIYHCGGHINAFRRADSLAHQVTQATRLPLVATRLLYASFGYLDRHHFQPRPPRRLWHLGNGNPKCIVALGYSLRVLDRCLHTRTSVYGWAFYFGDIEEEVETAASPNVCIHCGAGHSAASLICNHSRFTGWKPSSTRRASRAHVIARPTGRGSVRHRAVDIARPLSNRRGRSSRCWVCHSIASSGSCYARKT